VQTISDNLESMATEVMSLFVEYMLKHSSLEPRSEFDDEVVRINPYGDQSYREMDAEGRKVQSKLLKKYSRLHSIMESLLIGQSKETQAKLSELHRIVIRTIEHQITWSKDTRDALNEVIVSIQDQLKLFKAIYEPVSAVPVYVPDTNSLLYNTMLETWQFSDTPRFKILLLPTILSELDELKVNSRNENVREKAEKLIRQIKEYRRRGSLNDGVPLIKDKIDIMAIAVEPNMESALSWLDATNKDDRFLASVIEVMKEMPQTPVIIVTRDVNMQNKAEYPGIPFVEPPEI
jgi:hypothetical protein